MDQDVRKLDFQLPLCGRNAELSLLKQAFDTAAAEGSSKVVAVRIHGASGTGKSSLVNAFRERVSSSCVFGVGKFEQNSNASEPFSAIVDALSEIVNQLQNVEKTRQEFGSSSARVLGTIIPKLREEHDKENIVSKREATSFDRLKFAARDFLRLVCKEKPVVVFLDDLQWAKYDSLEFVEALVTDKNAGKLLLVCSHREIPGDHAVHGLFDTTGTTQISLINLSLDIVVEIISRLLRKEKDYVRSLASVVHRKTRGNAIFVLQFLRFLEQNRYLTFSLRTFEWEWNVDTIQSKTNVSDNVVDMIVDKIQTSPANTRLALTIAACSGLTRFDLETLYSILQATMGDISIYEKNEIESEQELNLILEAASQDGLLEDLSNGKFKFAHDRVLESACSLLPGGTARTLLHYHIGKRMCEMSVTASDDSFVNRTRLLLLGVRQLNLGAEHVADQLEAERLARLNLEAAEVAMRKSAFFPAIEFLEAGIAKLEGGKPWDQHYELMIKLQTARVEMKLCCGDLDASRHLADIVLQHARTLDDKVGAYMASIESLFQQERYQEAIELDLSVLDQFGVKVPRRNLIPHLIVKVIQTKRLLRGKTDADLLSLPALTDKAKQAAEPFHSELADMAWLSSHGELMIFTALQIFHQTLLYGLTDFSCAAFAAYSLIQVKTGDIKQAYRFGKLALQLADQSELTLHKPHAMALAHWCSYHWFRPYQESLDPLFRAYEMSVEMGDVQHLFFRIFPYCNIYLICGLRLGPLEQDMKMFADLLTDYSRKVHVAYLLPRWQMVLNLMGRSNDPLILSGTAMDQERSIVEWNVNHKRALYWLWVSRMELAYYFNDVPLAEEMASHLPPLAVETEGAFCPIRVLFEGLIAFGMAKITKKSKYKRKGNRMKKQLAKWVKSGAINCHHMLLLLKAEIKAIEKKGDPTSVREFYDSAISTAAKLGILHHQALANERVGMYFLDIGDSAWATTYLTRARDLYVEWDAIGKSNQMEEKYHFLRSSANLASFASGGSRGSVKSVNRLERISSDRHKVLLD